MNELFCGDMPRQWMLICAQLAVLNSAAFGNAFAASQKHGTISVVGPAFVNREVTLKVAQFYPWKCDVEWRYILDNGTTVQTMNGTNVNRYSEDGSFFLKWNASAEYNRAQYYADCATNKIVRTQMTSLKLKDIVGQCGVLGLLSPVVLGTDVELGYFPSDQFIQRKTNRKWTKNNHEIQLHEGFYAEKRVTEYSYILTIFNFNKTDEGTYILNCSSHGETNSIQLHIPERPSFPVLGPKYPDFNTTKCIYVFGGSDFYCKTENGTEPVQVSLLVGNDSFALAETERNDGLYRLRDLHQHMAGLSRRNVTCQVSNAALETPYVVHGTLCSVEKVSRPVLRVAEQLNGENSTTICEVRDALPAPAIEIRVDKVLQADVQQMDLFNGSSHTFTSTATMTNTNKAWNGKRMCCTMKTNYEFGLANGSECKNISMKCDPSINLTKTSPVDLSPNKTEVVNCTVDDCNANGLWTLSWEDEQNSIIKTCEKTEECLLTLNYTGEGKKTYKCSASKSKDLLNILLTVSSSMIDGSQPQEKDDQTFSSTLPFPVNKVLIGTGIFCGLCILLIFGRCVFHKRRKVNEINTIEIVGNHSDTSLDNGVLHIETGGVQYAVMQRQAATQRTGTQQPHDGGGVTYAELDINFLQEANARVPPRKNNTPTEYADIAFSSTQKSAEEDHVYHNTSA